MHAVHNEWRSEGKNSFAQGSVSHRFSTRDIWMLGIMYFNEHHIGIKYFSAVLNFCTLLKWDGVGINKVNQFLKCSFERWIWLYSEEDILKLVQEECNQCVVGNCYQFLGQAVSASVVLLSYMVLLTHVAIFIKFFFVWQTYVTLFGCNPLLLLA